MAAGIFAGSGGEAESYCSCHYSMRVRAASPRLSGEAGRLLAAEVRCNGLAKSECDFEPLLVGPRSHCSLLPRPLVGVELPPDVFDIRRNQQPARQSMRWLFEDHNESVPGVLLGVPRSKLL